MNLLVRFAALFTAVGLLVTSASHAAEPRDGYKPEDKAALKTCLETAQRDAQRASVCIGQAARACESSPENSSSAGLKHCSLRENAYWDEILNDRYQQLLARFSDKNAKKLRAMQRTWIAWRKEKCELPYMLYEGGSVAGVLAADCIMATTGERALELDAAVIAP